jgi:hypothetical protein
MSRCRMLILTIWLPLLSLSGLPAMADMIVDTAWVRRYNGLANSFDAAASIIVDDFGNVYVTGESYHTSTSYAFATVKYSPEGVNTWVRMYDTLTSGSDGPVAIITDLSGNVYVAGSASRPGTERDYAIVKYDADGSQLWVQKYDGTSSGDDMVRSATIDDSGYVYVTGFSYNSLTLNDYVTAKYESSGDNVWIRRYDGSCGTGDDLATVVCVDSDGNVYVTGYGYGIGTSWDYLTIKYNSYGDTIWVRKYDGPAKSDDGAYAMIVDHMGNAYVTGMSIGIETYSDYVTIKYSPHGETTWVRRYNGPGNDMDAGRAITTDDSGNVYVTGLSYGNGTLSDYATIKYLPNGDTAWVRRYDGPPSYNDGANSIAVDDSGNVYVTGYSSGIGTGWDYATIKYNAHGEIVWVKRYSEPVYGRDEANAIAVDKGYNVYVTGMSRGVSTEYDYVTIKYHETGRWRGDCNADGEIGSGDVIYLLNYLFKGGPAPDPLEVAECNCDGIINLADVIFLINYLFKGGLPPSC